VQRLSLRILFCVLLLAIPLARWWLPASRVLARVSLPGDAQASDPWSSEQTVLPDALAKELNSADNAKKPTVACVGFHTLY
jgi:hypothetical protein